MGPGVTRRASAIKAGEPGRHRPSFVRVDVGPELDFGWALGFLAVRAVPSLEVMTGDGFERVVWLDPAGRGGGRPQPVTLAVQYRAAAAAPQIADGVGQSAQLVTRSAPQLPAAALRRAVARLFDLDADLRAFAAVAGQDSVLGPVAAGNPRGLRLLQLLDPFEALMRAILGQQVSVAAASTMTDRLVRLAAIPAPRLRPEGIIPIRRPRYAFPQAEAIVGLGPARLRRIGLTSAKTAAVHGAAVAVANGDLNLSRLRRAPAEEADRQLLALPGVGPWTAAYVRLRALGDRDAFPASDLGLVKALAARGVRRPDVQAAAERWRPWRGYATLHLWHSLHRFDHDE
jgi:3-methyladenine DNA glycosylase/8-oxoguanine DNA glycosylase